MAKRVRFIKNCLENRGKIASRGIDDAQDFRNCGLLSLRLVTLGNCLRELLLEFGEEGVADQLTCGQASDSFADLVGTEFPT
jgi:hypothetical protein